MPRFNGIIYKVTNLHNNKVYVGKTTQTLDERISDHIGATKRNSDNAYFHKAIRKHGKESFKWEIICECDPLIINILETMKIIVEHSHVSEGGYNLTWGGEGTNGYKFTDEQVKKLSESHIGHVQSDKTKEKRRISMIGKNKRYGKDNNRYGIQLSDETKEKIRKSNTKYNTDIIQKIIDYRNNKIKWKTISILVNIHIRVVQRLYADNKHSILI